MSINSDLVARRRSILCGIEVRVSKGMNNLLQNLRYAFRQLSKNPGFTAVAVVTLALAIGANTAIFSVVHRVLPQTLPYPHPGSPCDDLGKQSFA